MWPLNCIKKPDDFGNNDGLWYTNFERYGMGGFSMAARQANNEMEDYSQVDVGDKSIFAGIYDGQGGNQAAKILSSVLLQKLLRRIHENGDVISYDLLIEAITATNKLFVRDQDSYCLISLVWKDTLYIANNGDSRLVIGTEVGDTSVLKVEQLTRDQNSKVLTHRRIIRDDDRCLILASSGFWKIMKNEEAMLIVERHSRHDGAKIIALGNTERQWEIWRYDAQLMFLRLLHSLCENKYVAAGKCCWYWIKSVLGGSHQLDISNSFLVMTYGNEPPYKPSLKDIGVYWMLLLTNAYSEQRDLLLTICSTLVDAGTNQGGSAVGSVAHKLIVTVTTHLVIPFNWEVYFINHDVRQRSRRRVGKGQEASLLVDILRDLVTEEKTMGARVEGVPDYYFTVIGTSHATINREVKAKWQLQILAFQNYHVSKDLFPPFGVLYEFWDVQVEDKRMGKHNSGCGLSSFKQWNLRDKDLILNYYCTKRVLMQIVARAILLVIKCLEMEKDL
ncbi:putative protein phosphatase 2C 43-like protein [Trifolium pratense]|uniref:PPM-type phosphatase domain-containing protein n=1 Tax=Trifolium pratense TaxID=57577 RepID=A0A2K3L5E6_TRIPR|nr:putative protein phosphatase 2C 43-like protein [Trifolium pratense]